MTIVQCIDNVTNWLNKEVCPKVQLRLPTADGSIEQSYTDAKAVNPTAFAMYQPGKDKLPPNVVAPFPSVVVQLLEGSDSVTERNGRIKIQLSFTAWNPGNNYGAYAEAGDTSFKRDAEGWKDVWNFVDRTLRMIENVEYLNDVRFVKELPVTYGQFQQEGQISDLYPYWGAWAIFTIERGIARTGEPYKIYL